jgi:ABC-2 type transport system ATP-binding protein
MNLLTESNPKLAASKPVFPGQEVIRLEKVSVCYKAPNERVGTFKEYIIRRLQRKIHHESFLALRDVDLSVYQGEVFGLIGNNGAGKSTLLKLVARVLRPTKGRVWVKGRVAPLLEIGAGFHPELSGRENVYLNGAMLGFTRKEMEKKFDGIVEFAEIANFIEAPLRTYSAGMWARLGFAVATDVDPDILIVDEVLAVGDEGFQRKSSARLQSIREHGATIVLVSHNMTLVEQMCKRAAWLDHGQIQIIDDAKNVIKAYRQCQR